MNCLRLLCLLPVLCLSACGGGGPATSNTTVNAAAPSVTSQPVSQTVSVGQTATFSVAATGTAPLSYQWQKNGTNIAGATAASYTTPATTAADNNATFAVVVTNALGSVTSTGATLTVNTPPAITTQPASQTVNVGQTATFSVSANGTAPVTYQWRRNGSNISGAVSPTYTTPVVSIADTGTVFDVMIGNTAGSVTSNAAVLTVSGGTGTSTPTASTLSIGFNPKLLQFTWTAATGATFYRLLRNPDGVSSFTPVGADIVAPAAGINLDIAVYQQKWSLARYALDACNTAGCTRSNEVTISSGMLAAIGYLKASNTAAGDEFGVSVALSSDGSTLAVGAQYDDSNATGINGNQADNSAVDSGAVFLFTRANGVWSQQAYIKASNTGAGDAFGLRVALSSDGNTLAVGAWLEDSNATGVNGNQADNSAVDSGAAYVFTRTSGVWSQQAYVKASNTDAGDAFGFWISLASDGNTMAVSALIEDSNATGIGGNQADNSAVDSGAAYVFTRSSGVWSQQAYVKASNTDAGDRFGLTVALSGDGNTMAVGAQAEDSNATGINGNQADNSIVNSGAAYVFTRTSGVWSQQAYVKASNPGTQDMFCFVALSGDGNTMAVGANFEGSSATGINGNQSDNSAVGSGAVYLFTRTSGVWSQQAYLKASNTGAGDQFGFVALSSDGNTLAVSAGFEDSDATGIGGNQADNSAIDSGAVYVFTHTSGVWSQQAYVKASNTGAGGAFGSAVALSSDGNTLAVGAYLEDSNATGIGGNQADNSAAGSGAVYVY